MEQRIYKAFDTINVVQAHDCPASVFDDVGKLIERCEWLFSHTLPDGELARINNARGAAVRVHPELASCIKHALAFCDETDGLFDITMGPVVGLWDFRQGTIPSRKSLDEALRHVDYRLVQVDGSTVRLGDPDARIVLGGIAKGFIADAILELLAKRGIEHALVNLGGNVAVMGGKPDGSPYRIGIRKPVASNEGAEQYLLALPLHDGSMVTSGVYERCFMRDGVRYHHILNPQTGMPARTDLLSATVVARRSIDADGYTTALVIMGLDRARRFVDEHEGIEAVFITADGQIVMSAGLESEPVAIWEQP